MSVKDIKELILRQTQRPQCEVTIVRVRMKSKVKQVTFISLCHLSTSSAIEIRLD